MYLSSDVLVFLKRSLHLNGSKDIEWNDATVNRLQWGGNRTPEGIYFAFSTALACIAHRRQTKHRSFRTFAIAESSGWVTK
jgi:hypothetical protein